MATLRTRPRRDGTTSFTVLFRLGKTQTSELFESADSATAFMRLVDKHGPATARSILSAHKDADLDGPSVAEHLTNYIASRGGITEGTKRMYERYARSVTATPMGDLPLTAVKRSDVKAWVDGMAGEGLSEKTMKNRKQFLSGAFADAVNSEPQLMSRNPCAKIEVPRTERREMTVLEGHEVRALLEAVDEHWRGLITVLVGTGLRFGEAAALQVRDLQLYDTPPTLRVSRGWVFTAGAPARTGAPKTQRGRRTISLPTEVVTVLRAAVVDKAAEDWIFTWPDGRPITRSSDLRPHWLRWVEASGIGKRPRTHDLRHTHASILIGNGVPLTVVQHRLGHASIKVTSDTYTHIMPESQVQASRAASLAIGALPQLGQS